MKFETIKFNLVKLLRKNNSIFERIWREIVGDSL